MRGLRRTPKERRLAVVPLVLLLLVSALGPIIAPYGVDESTALARVTAPDGGTRFVAPPFPPSEQFLFGTDPWGYDLFSLMLYGARYTVGFILVTAVARVILGFVIASVGFLLSNKPIGPNGRRRGGRFGSGILPEFVVAYLILSAISINPPIPPFPFAVFQGAVVTLVSLPALIPTLRGKIDDLATRPYVEAEIAAGAGRLRIWRTSVVPGIRDDLVVLLAQEALLVALVIGELAAFHVFVGGTHMTFSPVEYHSITHEWVGLVGAYRHEILAGATWLVLAPLTGYAALVGSLVLAGRALEPRRGRGGVAVRGGGVLTRGGVAVDVRARPANTAPMASKPKDGKLRIGDHWNAIRIIALSQSNPLKAIAEFVENSIDARATRITVVRGKSRGEQYVKILDDGEGIPDFRYVATHIGDSIKRKLKREGETGIQGEFGIGLLSFWTIGQELTITARDAAGVVRKMKMVRDSPSFSIRDSRELIDRTDTELHIQPILPGVRMLTAERIQSYLASELRDRITKSGVTITIVDRGARKQLEVVPRMFQGVLMHGLPTLRSALGEIYAELYLTNPQNGVGVGLYKSGTRVIENLCDIPALDHSPWSSGHIEGIVDADFLTLTPGTRSGIVYDEASEELVRSLGTIEEELRARIEEQARAEEEEASKDILRRITKALRDAVSMLPDDQYNWLAAQVSRKRSAGTGAGTGTGAGGSSPAPEEATDADREDGDQAAADGAPGSEIGVADSSADREKQRPFYEIPGPLYRVAIRPRKSTVKVGEETRLAAVAMDRSRRVIEGSIIEFTWSLVHGAGALSPDGEFATYAAPAEPELATVQVTATQVGGATDKPPEAESLVTVTADLIPRAPEGNTSGRGLPGYTFVYLPGTLWRSRYNADEGLIRINSGHPDFVHAARQQKTKLRYLARLYAKELVLSNFPGVPAAELLEHFVELTLYMDENLR